MTLLNRVGGIQGRTFLPVGKEAERRNAIRLASLKLAYVTRFVLSAGRPKM